MIANDEFSKLRLRDFCTDNKYYREELDEHAFYLEETIPGIWFGRPIIRPDETFRITVSLLGFSEYWADIGPAILARLGLPFTRESTTEHVFESLGLPRITASSSPDDATHRSDIYQFHLEEGGGYEIECVFLEPGAGSDWLPCYRVPTRSLWDVRVERSDHDSIIKEIEDRCQ
ncbi:MAG: hypothetical protein ABI042_13925 [Verrucomicrobiota bacterium]